MKWILIVMMAAVGVAAAQTDSEAQRLLKAAQNAALVDHNLEAAIKQYNVIVEKYAKSDRGTAAAALLGLAECYQKLGDDRARRAYERLVREFGDQKDAVALARSRLGASAATASTGQPTARLVWSGPKAAAYGSSVSPDGRFISFPDWDTGNLGLHDVVTGADRLLTSTGVYSHDRTEFAESSAISKDGKRVAYAWFDSATGNYELRVIGLNGDAKPRRVFADPDVVYLEPRDWSPDGRLIGADLTRKNEPNDLMGLIDTQTGSLRLLKPGTDNKDFRRFSPDGKYIIYTSRPAAVPRRLARGYISSVDGDSEVPLVAGTSSVVNPVWTPDGSRVVFLSDRSGSNALWSVSVANGKPTAEPELLRKDADGVEIVDFVRDGMLFYGVTINLTDIYVAGLDPATGKLTSEPRRVNDRAVGNSWGRIAWVPDGRSLSFWNRSPFNALVIHTLATGEERELWRNGAGYAGWFPTGRSLMSHSGINGGQTVTFRRIDGETGAVQASWTVPGLPPGAANVTFPSDLMTLFFSRKDDIAPCDGNRCTFVMFGRDLATGKDREIFRNKGFFNNVSISRDGRQMAFTTIDRDGQALMVVPTAGGAPREIYRRTEDRRLRGTDWTPDGSFVVAMCGPSPGSIWSIPTRGGSPVRSPLRMRPSEKPAISPDGRQIAFVGGSNTSEIWVMTGLFKKNGDAGPK